MIHNSVTETQSILILYIIIKKESPTAERVRIYFTTGSFQRADTVLLTLIPISFVFKVIALLFEEPVVKYHKMIDQFIDDVFKASIYS